MFNFRIDSEFALSLLGIFSVILIVATILFVSQKLGIQTYSVLDSGSPCTKIYCPNQSHVSQEISRDWTKGFAICACDDGTTRQMSLFA
jgi:hypothetical protein